MNLKSKKRMACEVGHCSDRRVIFNPERIEEISKAITKSDIRALINDNAIVIKHKRGVSRGRAREHDAQKRKGRRKGHGSRKGKMTARLPQKQAWIAKIRMQRKFIKELKDKGLVNKEVYRILYLKAKGGFFRSKNHIKIYLNEKDLVIKPNQENKNKV
ncbi:MAG: 50S ribosomal protein L19e [Nanoarchaeota archaeon]|nr:50S ribosomal protein L19e [Nanoarchaeota archaeon]